MHVNATKYVHANMCMCVCVFLYLFRKLSRHTDTFKNRRKKPVP